jgi:DNA-directed RNA polymerase specialized sigma24 family protein
MSDAFHTTRWTLVRHATGHSAEGQAALSELCEAYYAPVVAFLRRSGRDEDAAREAAHAFFAEVLARPSLGGAEPGRGRFRSYLLGALKHHLAHARKRDSRQKRGDGAATIPLAPGTDTSPGVDAADTALPPDREFDRQWALHILHRAMEALAAEAENPADFAALRPFIAGEGAHGALHALAETRGIPAATLRANVTRLRQRFRHHVKAQIAPTLDDPASVETEMAALLAALAG